MTDHDKAGEGGDLLDDDESGPHYHTDETGKLIQRPSDPKQHSRLKQALAENMAQLRVLADRYVQIMARCQREIDAERAKPAPSQFKIEALAQTRNRAEERLARFKVGADQLPPTHAYKE